MLPGQLMQHRRDRIHRDNGRSRSQKAHRKLTRARAEIKRSLAFVQPKIVPQPVFYFRRIFRSAFSVCKMCIRDRL